MSWDIGQVYHSAGLPLGGEDGASIINESSNQIIGKFKNFLRTFRIDNDFVYR